MANSTAKAREKRKAEQDTKRLEAFDNMIKALDNKHREKGSDEIFLSKLGDNPPRVETISSGSLTLDEALGGGFGRGRLVEIFGKESSGKTSIALNAIASVQKEGGNAVFVDLEQALDPVYARKLGVNTGQLAVTQPDSAEQALNFLSDVVASGVVDIVVVDSVSALVPQAEIDGEIQDQSVAVVARMMSKSLRGLVAPARKSKTTVIFINQLRAKIGGWSPSGDPTTTSGGKALPFYASQRLQISPREVVKEGGKDIGRKVNMKVIKNKIAPPFQSAESILTFNRGINRQAELIETAPKYDVIDLTGRTYSYIPEGENELVKIATNQKAAIEALRKDKALFEELSERLREAIQAQKEADFEDEDFEDSEAEKPVDDEAAAHLEDQDEATELDDE